MMRGRGQNYRRSEGEKIISPTKITLTNFSFFTEGEATPTLREWDSLLLGGTV
jgi:hypothetical protein